jgi:hypothetical protein
MLLVLLRAMSSTRTIASRPRLLLSKLAPDAVEHPRVSKPATAETERGRREREREKRERDERRETRDEGRGTRDERRGTRDEGRGTRDERRETRERDERRETRERACSALRVHNSLVASHAVKQIPAPILIGGGMTENVSRCAGIHTIACQSFSASVDRLIYEFRLKMRTPGATRSFAALKWPNIYAKIKRN